MIEKSHYIPCICARGAHRPLLGFPEIHGIFHGSVHVDGDEVLKSCLPKTCSPLKLQPEILMGNEYDWIFRDTCGLPLCTLM